MEDTSQIGDMFWAHVDPAVILSTALKLTDAAGKTCSVCADGFSTARSDTFVDDVHENDRDDCLQRVEQCNQALLDAEVQASLLVPSKSFARSQKDVHSVDAALAARGWICGLPLRCASCGVLVHAGCYGVNEDDMASVYVNGAAWLCEGCTELDASLSAVDTHTAACSVCPVSESFRIGYGSCRHALKRAVQGHTVHASCAVFSGMFQPTDTTCMRQFVQTSTHPQSDNIVTSDSACIVCDAAGGVMVKLHHSDAKCHIPCALASKKVFTELVIDAENPYGRPQLAAYRCEDQPVVCACRFELAPPHKA